MNLHEFQAKQLLADYAVPVPAGNTARSAKEARAVAEALGGAPWMVKAQIHAGGRGKAGGIRQAAELEEVEEIAAELLCSRLMTSHTDNQGLPVNLILVEQASSVEREFYLSFVMDRKLERVLVMASGSGGVDVEALAVHDILRSSVEPVAGLQAYQCREIGFALGLTNAQVGELTRIMLGLYRLFIEKDATLVEINPLVMTAEGTLLALDAKIQIDDNALYRQPVLGAQRDVSQEDAREHAARQFGLNYITLEGNIACMVNGAGLAMATMDLIKLHGGEPANFLDVGGGTSAASVAEAFKLILSDTKVRSILVNIFGGIVRCDLIAEGIIEAASEMGMCLPLVVRLEGTHAERGRELLRGSGLAITAASNLTDAAVMAVASVTNSGE